MLVNGKFIMNDCLKLGSSPDIAKTNYGLNPTDAGILAKFRSRGDQSSVIRNRDRACPIDFEPPHIVAILSAKYLNKHPTGSMRNLTLFPHRHNGERSC